MGIFNLLLRQGRGGEICISIKCVWAVLLLTLREVLISQVEITKIIK